MSVIEIVIEDHDMRQAISEWVERHTPFKIKEFHTIIDNGRAVSSQGNYVSSIPGTAKLSKLKLSVELRNPQGSPVDEFANSIPK